jgi:hypothetical protein
MVQTPLGAKSNPWIAYMKQCREHYNVTKSAGGEPLVPNEMVPKDAMQLACEENTKKDEIKKPARRRSKAAGNETKKDDGSSGDATIESFLPRATRVARKRPASALDP